MVRPLRIEYKGAWYHITCRGNEQKDIFITDKDRHKFLKILKESLKVFKVELHCFVLMKNHFHLLLRTPQGNLKRFMQRFNTTYTVYFNKSHRRIGHLLQGRYKALLVEADEYLLELSRYIHLNPIKLKMYNNLSISEKKEILRKYKWSSFLGYIGTHPRNDYVHYDMVLKYMGNDNTQVFNEYGKFVLSGLAGDLSNIYDNTRGQIILGGDSFFRKIQEHFFQEKTIHNKDYAKIKELHREVKIEEIAKLVAAEYGIEVKAILKKRSDHIEARQILIELSYRYNFGKKSLRELGKELGPIGGDAIIQTHKRLQSQLMENSDLIKKIEIISNKLISKPVVNSQGLTL